MIYFIVLYSRVFSRKYFARHLSGKTLICQPPASNLPEAVYCAARITYNREYYLTHRYRY
jgi:hypothetical protein